MKALSFVLLLLMPTLASKDIPLIHAGPADHCLEKETVKGHVKGLTNQNPYSLRENFDADGRPDYAVTVKEIKTQRINPFYLRGDFAGAKTKSANKKQSMVGLIKGTDLAGECGCYFQFPSQKMDIQGPYVFLSMMDENAWMNIGGKDVELELVKVENFKPDLKNGDRYRERYKAGATIAQVEYRVTGACDPDNESCEFTYMDATITVKHRGRSQTVKVTGGCGC